MAGRQTTRESVFVATPDNSRPKSRALATWDFESYSNLVVPVHSSSARSCSFFIRLGSGQVMLPVYMAAPHPKCFAGRGSRRLHQSPTRWPIDKSTEEPSADRLVLCLDLSLLRNPI